MVYFLVTTMYLNFKSKLLVQLLLLFISFGAVAEPARKLKSVNLDITTHLGDQQIYHAGDKLGFMLSLNQDAYVYLFYQDSENHLLQLLPNAQQKKNLFKAGLYIPLPDPDAPFSFRVEAPFGTDQVWAFAVDHQVAMLPGQMLENGLILMSQTIDQVRSEIRAQAKQVFDQSSKQIITRPDK
jgi:hypothetical protein